MFFNTEYPIIFDPSQNKQVWQIEIENRKRLKEQYLKNQQEIINFYESLIVIKQLNNQRNISIKQSDSSWKINFHYDEYRLAIINDQLETHIDVYTNPAFRLKGCSTFNEMRRVLSKLETLFFKRLNQYSENIKLKCSYVEINLVESDAVLTGRYPDTNCNIRFIFNNEIEDLTLDNIKMYVDKFIPSTIEFIDYGFQELVEKLRKDEDI